jgi:hypothetical protein
LTDQQHPSAQPGIATYEDQVVQFATSAHVTTFQAAASPDIDIRFHNRVVGKMGQRLEPAVFAHLTGLAQ